MKPLAGFLAKIMPADIRLCVGIVQTADGKYASVFSDHFIEINNQVMDIQYDEECVIDKRDTFEEALANVPLIMLAVDTAFKDIVKEHNSNAQFGETEVHNADKFLKDISEFFGKGGD